MDTLLVVDIQYDFLPGGALGVKNGHEVIPVANQMLERFEHAVATRDWHPPNHKSFSTTHGKAVGEVIQLHGLAQVLWPPHCVQGTKGAEFHKELKTDAFAKVIDKGVDPEIDSYGAFYDNEWKRATGLEEYLKDLGCKHLYILGLTTDYCVKYTALDGLKLGFEVTVIRDGCRPVNLQPGDEELALSEMESAGAHVIVSDDLSA